MLRLIGILAAFIVATVLLYLLWSMAPPSDTPTRLVFPKDLDVLREIADSLVHYKWVTCTARGLFIPVFFFSLNIVAWVAHVVLIKMEKADGLH